MHDVGQACYAYVPAHKKVHESWHAERAEIEFLLAN